MTLHYRPALKSAFTFIWISDSFECSNGERIDTE